MSLTKKKREILSQINVTPFIDVMLVLVVMLIITSSVIVTELQVNLPESSSGEQKKQLEKEIDISVGKNKIFYFEGKRATIKEISKKLAELKKNNINPRVSVYGDSEALYGDIVEIVDLLKQNQISTISLPIKSKAG